MPQPPPQRKCAPWSAAGPIFTAGQPAIPASHGGRSGLSFDAVIPACDSWADVEELTAGTAPPTSNAITELCPDAMIAPQGIELARRSQPALAARRVSFSPDAPEFVPGVAVHDPALVPDGVQPAHGPASLADATLFICMLPEVCQLPPYSPAPTRPCPGAPDTKAPGMARASEPDVIAPALAAVPAAGAAGPSRQTARPAGNSIAQTLDQQHMMSGRDSWTDTAEPGGDW